MSALATYVDSNDFTDEEDDQDMDVVSDPNITQIIEVLINPNDSSGDQPEFIQDEFGPDEEMEIQESGDSGDFGGDDGGGDFGGDDGDF